jgi:predicted exporter
VLETMERNEVGSPVPGSTPELERLTDQLAQNARATAVLLTTRGYDEAELAELDRRGRELRAAIAVERGKLAPVDDDADLAYRHRWYEAQQERIGNGGERASRR